LTIFENNNNNNNNSFNICKEIGGGVKIDIEQVKKVRLPYYGTNKCELTIVLPTINRTS